MVKVSVKERFEAALREKPISTNKKVDIYLTENLPDLVNEHKLATKNDFGDINRTFDTYENDVLELETWRDKSKSKVNELTERIERLELKYGGV